MARQHDEGNHTHTRGEHGRPETHANGALNHHNQGGRGDQRQEPSITWTSLAMDLPLEEIPETQDCIGCGQPAARMFLALRTPYQQHGKPFLVHSDRVPGYRCGPCDLETTPLRSARRFLRAALEVVRAAGDRTAAQRLAASLEAMQQPSEDPTDSIQKSVKPSRSVA